MTRTRFRTRRMALVITIALLATMMIVHVVIEHDPSLLDPSLGVSMGIGDLDGALAAAIETRDIDAVRRAIARGAGLDTPADVGGSPLTRAVSVGDAAVCAELLAHGAAPDGAENEGIPPLVRATIHGRGEIVDLLLRGGADVSVTAASGSTALHTAAFFGHADIAAALIAAGAELDAVDAHGWTPLMDAAAQAASNPVMEALLAAGARVDVADAQGNTALQIASRGDNRVGVALLRRRSADPHHRNLLSINHAYERMLRNDVKYRFVHRHRRLA